MVVIDANMLLLLIHPSTKVPSDASGNPVKHARERVQGLIADLEKARIKVLVPTPALSEVLVRAGEAASEKIVDEINKHSVFRIESFDARAAIEVAAMARKELAGRGKRKAKLDPAATYAKLKYDRQIVAIAKVNGADMIYSDDDDVRSLATQVGIKVTRLADLPLPAEKLQMDAFNDATK